jgi:serine/threonine protein kinase/tetratricopeptide (TPR) repeat protein
VTATDSQAALPLGTIIAEYAILKVLAKDEIGIFYLARNTTGPRAFLRVVSESVTGNPATLGRVERTLQSLANVVHRNVAGVIGGAEDDDCFYYVLDAPGATTLFDLAYSGRSLTERELVWLGRGLTAGIAATHAAGLTNGGLGPNRVIVTQHGPIIVDLGWTSRITNADLEPTEDLYALRDTLLFAATSRSGKTTDLSDSVTQLLDALGESDDASEVAQAWSKAADALHLPDPMAPESLKKLLTEHESAHGSDGTASDEQRMLPNMPLDASGEILLSDSDVHTVLPGQDSSLIEAPGSVSSDAALSAVNFAKSILAEFPVDPLSQESDALPSDTPSPADDDSSVTTVRKAISEGAEDKDKTAPALAKPKTSKAKRSKSKGADTDTPTVTPPVAKKSAKPKKAAKTPSKKPTPAKKSGKKNSETGLGPKLGGFGAYTLKEELVSGRSSTIYRASRADTDRPLAVKVLHPDLLDEKGLTRFLRGAESSEALQHKAIAKVIDCGVEESWVFVTSQFVEGRTLAEECLDETAQERLPGVMLSVLEAVQYAHARGITHGDLKPKNIMITTDGEARILEFGIPRPPSKGGKPAPATPFGAPEARPGAESEVSEVYSLGLVLYAAAAGGKLPKDAGVAARVLTGNPPPPSAFDDSVPWQINAIALQAIQDDPDRRYPSVFEMSEDLRRCVKGPLLALRPSLFRRFGLSAYAQPIAASLLLVVGALAVIVLGAKAPALIQALSNSPQVAIAPPTQQPDDAPTAGPQGAELKRLRESELRLQDRLNQQNEAMQTSKRDWDRQSLERARRLVIMGESLLAADQLEQARAAFTEAQELAPLQAAQDGISEADLRLARPRTDPPGTPTPTPPPARRDAPAQYLRLGRGHMSAGRYREARSSLRKALSLGSTEAASLLSRVERKLFEAERLEDERTKHAAAEKRGATLADQAEQYASRGAFAPAFQAYLDALAADPTSQAARDGLARLRTLEAKTSSAGSVEDHSKLLQQELRKANEALIHGRGLYKKGEEPDQIYAAYLFALKALDRASFHDPQSAAVQRERIKVAQELAAILRDHGQTEFAEVILRANGISPETAKPAQVPLDPYLVLEEAERVSIRRAFGGSVRFEPTDPAFSKLRTWIKAQGERYRIVIQVKSKIQKGFPPAILASGVWIRLEDKISKTKSASRRISFSGGPHKRLVRVTARGRIVLPFTRINVLRQRYVPEVAAMARELLTETNDARKAKAKAERLRKAKQRKTKKN